MFKLLTYSWVLEVRLYQLAYIYLFLSYRTIKPIYKGAIKY